MFNLMNIVFGKIYSFQYHFIKFVNRCMYTLITLSPSCLFRSEENTLFPVERYFTAENWPIAISEWQKCNSIQKRSSRCHVIHLSRFSRSLNKQYRPHHTCNYGTFNNFRYLYCAVYKFGAFAVFNLQRR